MAVGNLKWTGDKIDAQGIGGEWTTRCTKMALRVQKKSRQCVEMRGRSRGSGEMKRGD